MSNEPTAIAIRADWYNKTMKHLLKRTNNGLVVLNDFAKNKLHIDPENIVQGIEFDLFLQGLEDRNLIFYRAKELTEGGKAENKRNLNNVEFSAILQNEGWILMSEVANANRITTLTKTTMLIALAALITSLGSLYFQSIDTTDEELNKLNREIPQFRQLLQGQDKSQQDFDETQHQIRDSL